MKKSELIKKLEEIEGDFEVIDDDYCDIHRVIVEEFEINEEVSKIIVLVR